MLGCLRAGLEAICGVTWTAMTGKAARRMSEASGIDAKTLHSRLYWPPEERPDHIRFDAVRPWETLGETNAIVVIDEASMVTPKVRDDLNEWIMAGARILYVGDGYQLPPILSRQEVADYGRDFTIFNVVPGPALKEVIRSDDDVLRAATYLREEGKALLESSTDYEFRRAPIKTGIDDWFADPEDHVLITWRNKIRMSINDVIRQQLGHTQGLPVPGERILFCRNGQGVLNGEVATVDSLVAAQDAGPIERKLLHTDDGLAIFVNTRGREKEMDGAFPNLNGPDWEKYSAALRKLKSEARQRTGEWEDVRPIPITWAYCLTAHKAQGSEYRRVTVCLAGWDTKSKPFREMTTLPDGSKMPFAIRWIYTALTRAKERATLVLG